MIIGIVGKAGSGKDTVTIRNNGTLAGLSLAVTRLRTRLGLPPQIIDVEREQATTFGDFS